jgi:repressor LexA
MNEKPLTAKQQKIFDYIRNHIEGQGYPPTIRDICRAFGIKSPNGVMCHLRALQEKGRIERNEKLSRGITIAGVTAGGFSLPLAGLVAAGKAIEAEPTEDRLEIRELFQGDGIFALKVRGQSMIENQIADGDFVIIRRQQDADNGARVVAMVDKAMTLKKFYRRKSGIELVPANGTMTPIFVDPSRQDINILGVLIGVIRKC